MIDVNELLEEAIKETENLNDDEVFLVRDLFKGYVWNRIPRKDRLLLGTLFLNQVSKMDGNLKAIEKTSSNQQRYKKTTKQKNYKYVEQKQQIWLGTFTAVNR